MGITLKDIWNFLWHDTSIWSWLANFAISFIIIKFMFYPLLGLMFGTSYPLVAVVSGSMGHDGKFSEWWDIQESWYVTHGIPKEDFLKYPFKGGFNKGDIMILVGVEAKDIKMGDVIVFRGNTKEPIIHRVVKIYRENGILYYQTKGDHNQDSYPLLGETGITEDRILGKAVFEIPWLGWVKIAALKLVSLIQ